MLKTAIILAGGFGTRLQSLVNDLPKPMAPVNGEPFLNYQLNYLYHFGIKNVVFSLGYLAEKIMEYYQSEYKGMQLDYVTELSPLGTGGGIRLAMEKINEKNVVVLNGDSFFDVDLNTYFHFHESSASQISLALRKVADCSRYGTIEVNAEHRITKFKEKSGHTQEALINGGVYILNKELYLKNTSPLENFSIEKDFFENKLQTLTIKGFEFKGYFLDIGIPEDYTKAQNDFKDFKYR
jgi:D-glycero-alpha-D-manno-heptose 1-phosphate guanylyltransferase